MIPPRPCPWCNATRFGTIPDLAFDVFSDAKKKFGSRIRPHFSAVVCTGCGATQLFAAPTAHLLVELDHVLADVPEGPR